MKINKINEVNEYSKIFVGCLVLGCGVTWFIFMVTMWLISLMF